MPSQHTISENLSSFLPFDYNTLERLAKRLSDINIFLTGSIALYYQGFDLGRKPHDVDFVFSGDSYDEITKILAEFSLDTDDMILDSDSSYDVDLFLTGFKINDVLVEVRRGIDIKTRIINGIIMQDYRQIIDEKMKYALSTSSTAIKHQKDLETIGIDFDCYKKTFDNLEAAKKAFEKEKRRIYDLKIRNANNQIDFNAKTICAGQVRSYADSIYKYEIKSPLDIEHVEAVARDRIDRLHKVTNKGWCFSGSCSFPFGLEPYFRLSKDGDGSYTLLICQPYTG